MAMLSLDGVVEIILVGLMIFPSAGFSYPHFGHLRTRIFFLPSFFLVGTSLFPHLGQNSIKATLNLCPFSFRNTVSIKCFCSEIKIDSHLNQQVLAFTFAEFRQSRSNDVGNS